MAIGDDFSIATNGDIRSTQSGAPASGNQYTVIAFHRGLGDLQDDSASSSDDYMDITRAAPSERATDQQVTLNQPYNIDDHTARFLYDGSVIQDGGDTIYDPLSVLAPAGTPVEVILNGALVTPNYWGTALNANAAAGVSHRFLVKVRTGGADIDGRRVVVTNKEWGNGYWDFKFNAGTVRGSNVAALVAGSDLNNATTETTTETWTTIVNTEGYRNIDVDNSGADEYYFSEWDRAGYTINQFYERMKWLTAEPRIEDVNTDSGTNYTLGNGTINGLAQSFSNGANATHLVRAYFDVKTVGSPTGNATAKLYTISGTHGSTAVPTGAALATSETVDVSKIGTSYEQVEFGFSTTYEMTASTNYIISIEYTAGDATNYIDVSGNSTGTHAGNRSQLNGTWVASSGSDIAFEIQTSPDLYNIPGILFRGITHQLTMTTPRSGTWNAVERVTWPTGGEGIMVAVDSTTTATAMWIQVLKGEAPGTGVLITGSDSSATGTTSGTATARDISYPWCGASTGSALKGSYGFALEYADLTAADTMTALDALPYTPPDNQTWEINGLVSGDRVLVAPRAYYFRYDNEAAGPFTEGEALTFATPTGTATLLELDDRGNYGYMLVRMLTGSVPIDNTSITGDSSSATANVDAAALAVKPRPDTKQFTLNGALTGTSVTSVVVNEAIPTWLPKTTDTPCLRILRASGVTTRHPWSDYNTGTKTFTITAHDFSTDNAANGTGAYGAPIDIAATDTDEQFTGIYTSSIDLFYSVRDGGGTPIKSAEGISTFGSAGGSVTVNRISDE